MDIVYVLSYCEKTSWSIPRVRVYDHFPSLKSITEFIRDYISMVARDEECKECYDFFVENSYPDENLWFVQYGGSIKLETTLILREK